MHLFDVYGVAHGMVEIDNGVDHRPAFFAFPAQAQTLPGIVMIQERWGLDTSLRNVACRLAAEGFAVVVPDLFDAFGGPSRVESELHGLLGQLRDAQSVADLRGAVRFLLQRPRPHIEGIGTWGFCMGGRLALLLAGSDPAVGPCVCFYGNPVSRGRDDAEVMDPLEVVSRARGPVFGGFGAEDRSIPQSSVDQLETALREARIPHQLHRFPGAGHAFFNDARFSYHRETARAVWPMVLDFLRAAFSAERMAGRAAE